MNSKEDLRLQEASEKKSKWKKWGPYLSERQWGTVREDYSASGEAWDYFPHDHARSRVYRWGEDGIAGVSDWFQRLCFSVALWNGKDPILKERLFGLSGNEGNHGEDSKELYYYLDNTPTHSYMKYLYKYPQGAYPYQDLAVNNRNRSKLEPEYELVDTGLFNENKYFDVFIEYAKNGPEDFLIKISVFNKGTEAAEISVLPTLWFRNLWSFGLAKSKPSIKKIRGLTGFSGVKASHKKLGDYFLYYKVPSRELFTENETNTERLFNQPNPSPFVKDAFHRAVVNNDYEFLEGKTDGTKFSPLYTANIKGEESYEIVLRLTKEKVDKNPLTTQFKSTFQNRLKEADEFYSKFTPKGGNDDLALIQRQALAGLLWTKQYYNLDIERWINGDPGQPPPPESRKYGRNHEWKTLNNEDIISMPDKWEYPWYAAWDLAFHCVPLAMVDPTFAKDQLILIMREWYMSPNGQIPAYEWGFGDVNPPVHAWAALKVYEMEKKIYGKKDIDFLKRVFQKLMLNFTWWVNRKDTDGNNVFEGGFLGLDNIGVFDRNNSLPGDGQLEQADGTSWMGMYCLNMMQMALEISTEDCSFEDVATKFFEHFVYIAESINRLGPAGTGSWDEEEGFFYDVLKLPGERYIPLKVRSLVGLTSLFAVSVIDKERLKNVPGYVKRLKWFRNYRKDMNKYLVVEDLKDNNDILFSLVHKNRLERLLQALLDENEFLAPGGIRSLSKRYEQYYSVEIDGQQFGIDYQPGESTTSLFGGNSNWRGPIWMPMNYLIVQSLREYHKYYGDTLKVEFPSGSKKKLNLDQVADKISKRLIGVFQKDKNGNRPVNGGLEKYRDQHFKDLILFHEYFHGENSRGVGASHQTGWTAVVAEIIDKCGWDQK